MVMRKLRSTLFLILLVQPECVDTLRAPNK
jgi:hypothetical protein